MWCLGLRHWVCEEPSLVREDINQGSHFDGLDISVGGFLCDEVHYKTVCKV